MTETPGEVSLPGAGRLLLFYSCLFQDVAPVILIEIVALYRNDLTSFGVPEDAVLLALALELEPVLIQIIYGFLTLVHTVSPPSDGIITQNYTLVKRF